MIRNKLLDVSGDGITNEEQSGQYDECLYDKECVLKVLWVQNTGKSGLERWDDIVVWVVIIYLEKLDWIYNINNK